MLLLAKTASLERKHRRLVRVCLHCGGGGGEVLGRGGGGDDQRVSGPGALGLGSITGVVPGGGGGGVCAGVPGGAYPGCGGGGGVVCTALDCDRFYARRKCAHELTVMAALTQAAAQRLDSQQSARWLGCSGQRGG